ncbi:MAG: PKD domain-containing protein, partial [Candidatus Thermoplasmatota archaeon]|nr:PKD domain-containing protein [Candidatus Thermoplasmatota archaeon]
GNIERIPIHFDSEGNPSKGIFDGGNDGIWNVGDYFSYSFNYSIRYWQVSIVIVDKNSNSIIMSGMLNMGLTDYLFKDNTELQGTADFTWSPDRPVISETIQFSDASSYSSYIDMWSWDFGDGNNSTQQNPTHQYPVKGTYNVKLTVTYDGTVLGPNVNITNDSITKQVTVYQPPTANFTWNPLVPQIDENVTFDASSSSDDGNITLYEWDWNADGIYDDNSASPTTTHSWSSAGTYNVLLRVTDNDGFSGTITKNVRVNAPPIADFTFSPIQPTLEDTVQFSDTSTDADGTIVNWTWNFGDGNISYERNATHLFANEGSYTVTLTVKDNDNAVNSTSKSVVVWPIKIDFAFVDLNNDLVYTPGLDINVTEYITNDGIFYSWQSEGDYVGNNNSSLVLTPGLSNLILGSNIPLDLRANNSIVIDANITADSVNLEATDVYLSYSQNITINPDEEGALSADLTIDAIGSIFANNTNINIEENGNQGINVNMYANDDIYLRNINITCDETGNSPIVIDIESYNGSVDLTNSDVAIRDTGQWDSWMNIRAYDDLIASNIFIHPGRLLDVSMDSTTGDINISYATLNVPYAELTVKSHEGAVIAQYTTINAKSGSDPMLQGHTFLDFSHASITNMAGELNLKCDNSGYIKGESATITQNANKPTNICFGVAGNGGGNIILTGALTHNIGGNSGALTIKTTLGNISASQLEIPDSEGNVEIYTSNGTIDLSGANLSTALNSNRYINIYSSSNGNVNLSSAYIRTYNNDITITSSRGHVNASSTEFYSRKNLYIATRDNLYLVKAVISVDSTVSFRDILSPGNSVYLRQLHLTY